MIVKYIIIYDDLVIIKNNIEEVIQYINSDFVNIPKTYIKELKKNGFYKSDNLIIKDSFLYHKCCGVFIKNTMDLKEHTKSPIHLSYMKYNKSNNKKVKSNLINAIRNIKNDDVSFKVSFD